jgi:hypothetical protein
VAAGVYQLAFIAVEASIDDSNAIQVFINADPNDL